MIPDSLACESDLDDDRLRVEIATHMPADPRDRAAEIVYWAGLGKVPRWLDRAHRLDDGRPVTRGELLALLRSMGRRVRP